MATDDSTMQTKVCGHCKRELPSTHAYFYRDRSQKDGLARRCRECFGQSFNPPEPSPVPDGYKRCNRGDTCLHADGPILPADEHHFYPAKRGGFRSYCIPCSRQMTRENRLRDPEAARRRERELYRANWEQARAREAQYRARISDRMALRRAAYRAAHLEEERLRKRVSEHNRRAQKVSSGALMRSDVIAQYHAQGGKCWWCGTPVGDNYHVDHRIPLSKGGANTPDNICISCPTCNMRKYNKLPWEFSGRLL